MKKIENIHTYVWIEFAVWFFILCFIVAGVRIYRYHKAKELNTYQIFLSDVDGLIVGSPVKFMGVQIGYIDKVKIISDDVYLKIVITDKEVEIPKGAIATVEFSGMGGSKSLEVYPPTEESLASQKLIVVQSPKRLHDSLGMLSEMFDKIGSITNKLSYFATQTSDAAKNNVTAVDTKQIEKNVNMLDKWLDGAHAKRSSRVNKKIK